MATEPSRPASAQRPLLAGGERLRHDVDRPSGGGPKYHPRDVDEARAYLAPQLDALQQSVAATPAGLRGERVVFEARVLPNYLANSYFPADLFRIADLIPVGTRGGVGPYETKAKSEPEERATKTYLLAGDEQSLGKIAALVRSEAAPRGIPQAAYQALRQFDVVRMPPVEDVVRATPAVQDTELITWEAVLHPPVTASGRLTEGEHAAVMTKWANWVGWLGGEIAVDFQRVIKGMTFMPVRLPANSAEAAAQFNPLRAIRPMPKVRPIPVSPLRVVSTSASMPAVPAGQRPQSDVRIAAFDGGLDEGVAHLAPFADNIDVTPEPADPDAVAHGTMVTSALLYGPIEPGQQLRTPDVGVDHFRVVPPPSSDPWDVDLYWILDRIDELVSARRYPVVNLSLGPELSLEDDDEPHAWTARLDELAAETGTLFVVAAGNNGDDDAASGLNRIQVPADMVNGIAVGACDVRAPANPWDRAGYSAVGPGRPGGRLQPLGLAFGGVPGGPFQGIAPGAVIGEACGTSFASPVAAHGLASLTALIGADIAAPHVLRAFAVHFAEPTKSVSSSEGGFGRLVERYDDRFDCRPNEAIVLYCDSIERDQAISLPLPLPPDVVAKGNITVRYTLAFVAPTDPTDAVDYTQAGLDVAFRPHARRYNFKDPATGKFCELDTQGDWKEVARLLRAGATPPSLPATKSANRHRNEALQREEGKWETTLHYAKGMRASSFFEPQLTLSYLAREDGALAAAPPLEFAMLVTIVAPKGVELYSAVRQRFGVLTPLAVQLPLRLRA